MPLGVLHVCDKFGVAGSSIHGVSRLFSWWFPRYDQSRFRVSLCGFKQPEAASRLLQDQGVPVCHLGRSKFDPRILTDLVALGRELDAKLLHVHGYAAADFDELFSAAFAQTLAFGLLLVREGTGQPVDREAWQHMPAEHPPGDACDFARYCSSRPFRESRAESRCRDCRDRLRHARGRW